MSATEDSDELKRWGGLLGLLPVPLYGQPLEQQYVLLNGGQGNFCLDLLSDGAGDARSLAWSSDVGHYVRISGDNVEVFRWDRPQWQLERYPRKRVYDDVHRFHAYLENNEPRRDLSVINHAARVFGMLRRVLGPDVQGLDALRGYLYLLACTAAAVERGQLPVDAWQLHTDAAGIATGISEEDWAAVSRELQSPQSVSRLQPDIKLLLRHASGLLFQETHYQAYLPPQIWLPGFVPTEQVVLNPTTSRSAGVYFTPPALARTLVEEALAALKPLPSKLTLFDPACGSGEFLREALRLLKLQDYAGTVHLIGWDVSQAAVEMTKFILGWEARTWVAGKVTFDIKCQDSLLADPWPSGVQGVLMNPPFASWDAMSAQQQEVVTKVLANLARKKPNLASAFVCRAAGALTEGGVLGAIVPSSMVDADSTAPLRDYLAKTLDPRLIAKLGSQIVFQDAIVDAALYVGARQQTTRPATVLWADHRPRSISHALRHLRTMTHSGKSLEVIEGEGYSIYPSDRLGRTGKSWAPKSYQSVNLLAMVSRTKTVGDLFDVKQGVRLGNDVFIVPQGYWAQLPKKEQTYFRPAVMNGSVRNGRLQTGDYIFYPHFAEGKKLASEDELEAAVPTYFKEYLQPQKAKLSKRARIKADNWWRLMEHRAWLVAPSPKIVSTYFGDAGSFAWDQGGDHVVVVGYGWIPRAAIKDKLDKMQDSVWHAYIGLLSSPMVSKLLPAVSVHVGGGQWNLSKKYIEAMPLPDLTSKTVPADLVKGLAAAGKALANGEPVDETKLMGFAEAVYSLG
jgi:hypothetical protein